MLKYKKNIILFILITFSVFANCKENGNKMKVSFEQLQNVYYETIKKVEAKSLTPFYIDKNFFTDIEQTLNSLIAESDYVSVLISINIDNGIFSLIFPDTNRLNIITVILAW